MDAAEITFKALAVLHTVAGYLFLAFALDHDFQQECFYANCNPLAGDIKKYLVQIACWCLVGCGILAFHVPAASVALVWMALAAWFLTGFVEVAWTRRLPGLCIVCAANFGVRLSLAVGLTGLYFRLDG